MIAQLARETGLSVGSWPLWDAKFPERELRSICASDERSYLRGFRLVAFDDSEKTFPSFAECVEHDVDWRELPWSTWRFVNGVDIAGLGRAGTWSVCVGLRPDGVKVLGEGMIRRGKFTAPQALDAMRELDEEFSPLVHVVEDNASQKAYIEATALDPKRYPFRKRIVGHTTGSDKTDRAIGLPSLEVQFANAGWKIYFRERHRPDCDCDLCELVRQVDQYPFGGHDDALMALWQADFGLRLYASGRQLPGVTEPNEDRIAERMRTHEERIAARIAAITEKRAAKAAEREARV